MNFLFARVFASLASGPTHHNSDNNRPNVLRPLSTSSSLINQANLRDSSHLPPSAVDSGSTVAPADAAALDHSSATADSITPSDRERFQRGLGAYPL
eukprot:5942513-Pleurochrysis_carterae.AAC.1